MKKNSAITSKNSRLGQAIDLSTSSRPSTADLLQILYDLAHVAGWDSCDLHDLAHTFPGWYLP